MTGEICRKFYNVFFKLIVVLTFLMCVVCSYYQYSFIMFYIILLFSFHVVFLFLFSCTKDRTKEETRGPRGPESLT